jgi:hypothetical protein
LDSQVLKINPENGNGLYIDSEMEEDVVGKP